MIKRISKEEALARRRENFAKIEPGMLFKCGAKRWFIAVMKSGEKELTVVELTAENRLRILRGQPCETSLLHFDDMGSLNLY